MIAPGTILQNRYLVEEQIGQGGMGAVFVATDQRFGSRVALKETFFTDPNLRKAFEREARLLNRLRHHALPRVSDHFTEEEGQFLVMEYIPGDDLSEMLKARGAAFPLSDVLAWADQLLDALDYLHTQEPAVIHRDIKPQNLKLTARNQIVLLDFGLAKGTPLQTRVTATGSVLGYSLNYAPLEQMQGAGTDPRSDIYSLGATLHHLLTGETPPDALTRATAVLNGDEDPLRPASEIHAQVPTAVAALLTRALSQSAGRRFPSAAEMRDTLREASRDLPAEANAGVAPPSLAATLISEQETRLMDDAGTAHAARVASSKETNVNSQPEAPTPTDAARTAHVSPQATQAAPHAVTSVPDRASASTDAREEESVVTSVRAPREQAAAAATGGGRSRRTIGIAAGVVVAALVAAAVYAFTRPDRRPAQPATSTQPATVNATPSPEAQPTANVAASPQTAEAASPTPAPTQQQQPAQRRAGVATTARDASNTNRAGRGVNVATPDAPRPPGVFTEEEERELREAHSLSNRNFGPSQEEIQAIIRRSAEQRRRALQIQRENERRQRRRPRITPLPPPPTPEP